MWQEWRTFWTRAAIRACFDVNQSELVKPVNWMTSSRALPPNNSVTTAVLVPFRQEKAKVTGENVFAERGGIRRSRYEHYWADDRGICVANAFICDYIQTTVSKVWPVAVFFKHCTCEYDSYCSGFSAYCRVRLGAEKAAWWLILPGKANVV